MMKKALASRRAFLRMGGGGLVAAASIFGTTQGANALCKYKCCNLAHCPNINYQTCMSSGGYSWRCYYSQSGHTWQCQCCETPGNAKSAAACWPT